MGSLKPSLTEFIRSEFSPRVAIICSNDVGRICGKNELSFVEMVQPFFKLAREVSIRDPSNTLNTLVNFQVIIHDINYQPLQPAISRKLLNDVVSQSQCHLSNSLQETQQVTIGNYVFNKYNSTPWFEDYRNLFFQVFYPSSHEFFHHYLACMFVVSSSSPQPLEDIANLLKEQQVVAQNSGSSAKWFFTNILKYFVLLHDVGEGDIKRAEEVFQHMKGLYGTNVCHLLQINSFSDSLEGSFTDSDTSSTQNPWLRKTFAEKPSGDVDSSMKLSVTKSSSFPKQSNEENLMESSTEDILCGSEGADVALSHPLVLDMENPSPTSFKEDIFSEISSHSGPTRSDQSQQKTPGACLTASDIERVQTFAFEFCTNGLFPFVESQMRILNEQVANRKGLHRSLFSATKKWLASGKPGVQSPMSNTVVYNPDSPELQIRRLGDLAFMFQLYEVAYQAYHTAKREFNTDQAWLYFAGALEMAALSVFMQGPESSRQYPMNYMELAITTYLSTCKSVQLATRATILSAECLKTKGFYNDAAAQLIRLTSEDSDLRSALLLEQAALCFLNGRPPFPRKYAFHMVLAGHRFSKAGHKKHALRAYKLAYQVYHQRGWRVSEDHVNYTMGRLSINLGQVAGATEAYWNLLAEESLQPQLQQYSILKEFINVLKHQSLGSPTGTLPLLPLPVIDCQSAVVFIGSSLEAAGDTWESDMMGDKTWLRLEELAVIQSKGTLPFNHKPQLQCLSDKTDNTAKSVSAVNEVITICLPLKNILHIPVMLCNMCLLWKFTPASGDSSITNESQAFLENPDDTVVETQVISKIILQPLQSPKVHLSLTPRSVGEIIIVGVAYELHGSREDSYDGPPHSGSENDDSNGSSAKKCVYVRGKREFHCKGPRLNNTKEEKVDCVYGPDLRFTIMITPPMPRLKVDFRDFPRELMGGEVRVIQAHFENVGNCPLYNLMVASPTPEVFSFGISTSGGAQELAGTTGKGTDVARVLRIPHQGDVLQPGEAFEIPIWIRGPDMPGVHCQDFLFYYEAFQEKTFLRHRVLCRRLRLAVKPSILFKAFVTKSCCLSGVKSEENSSMLLGSLNIDLEVESLSEPKNSANFELHPVHVYGISESWKLMPLAGQFYTGKSIHPRETVHFILKAVPLETESKDGSQKISEVLLNAGSETLPSSTPYIDFVERSQFKLPPLVHDPSQVISDSQFFRATEPQPSDSMTGADASSEQTNLLKLAERSSNKVGLLLALVWKVIQNSDPNVITGVHQLMVKRISPSQSALVVEGKERENYDIQQQLPLESSEPLIQSPTANNLKRMINFAVQHPLKVSHEFTQNRLCIIPVELIAHNCCQVDLSVCVDTSKSSSMDYEPSGLSPCSSPTTYRGPAAAGFMWIGPTQLCKTLAPGGVLRLSLKAAFAFPGTYNLTNMFVSARPSTANPSDIYVAQHSLSPSLIVVASAS